MEEALSRISAAAAELTARLDDGLVAEKPELGSGLGLLDLKNALMRSYLAHLAFLVAWKTAGKKLQGHPVVAKLAELRVYLDKLKTVEAPLTYRISKLLAMASEAETADLTGDPADLENAARPNPDALVGLDANADADGDGDAVYRPPRFSEVNYDGPEERAAKREARAKERMAARARQSVEVRELLEEVTDLPEEIRGQSTDHRAEDAVDAQERERTEYEERNFLRLPAQSKKEKRRQRERESAVKPDDNGFSQSHVADVLAMSSRMQKKKTERNKEKLLRDSEQIGAMNRSSAARAGPRKGAIAKSPLQERKARRRAQLR